MTAEPVPTFVAASRNSTLCVPLNGGQPIHCAEAIRQTARHGSVQPSICYFRLTSPYQQTGR